MSTSTEPSRSRGLRILLIHNRYRTALPSGENQVFDDEAMLLSNIGNHTVRRYERLSDDIEDMSPFRRLELPLRVSWSTTDAREVGDVIKSFKPDVVHLHNSFPLISASVAVAAKRAGVPIVATLHNYRLTCANGILVRADEPCQACVAHGPWPAVMHGCYRDSRAATIPIAAAIAVHRAFSTWSRSISRFIVMSRFGRDLMVRGGLSPDQIVIKPHSVARPERSRIGAGDGVLFVGRLTRHKGLDLLLDAWDPSVGTVTVIGDGEQRRELESQASRLGVHASFLGSLPQESVFAQMIGARMLVQPSRAYETFGLATAEAMARAVPPVVPLQGALAELVTTGATGMTFDSGRVESLRSAMAFVADPGVSQRLGRAAQREYEGRLTPSRNLEALERIYRAVIAEAIVKGGRHRRTMNW